jgi:two-component system, NtrC family, sensor kinase
MSYSLTTFSLSDIVRCGATIRALGEGARSMEDVSSAIVQQLFQSCRDPKTGEPEIALARVFKTHAFGDLPPELQEAASRMSASPLSDFTKCLVLLGSCGTQLDWNSRHDSTGHKAIPLVSEESVSRIPMIAQLVRQLGLDLASVVQPSCDLLMEFDERNYNIFYVPHALDSPFVPAQEKFVKAHGIQSVIGFGGMLPTGNLFSVILFARAEVQSKTADAFRTVALCVKTAILPYEDRRVFNGFLGPSESEHVQLASLRSKAATLEELGKVYDRTVLDQSGILERAVNSLQAANYKLEREIEWRKRAESELAQAQKLEAVGQLAAGIAHEINTPIQYVNDNLIFLRDSFASLKTVFDAGSQLVNVDSDGLHEAQV